MTAKVVPVPYDPELAAGLAAVQAHLGGGQGGQGPQGGAAGGMAGIAASRRRFIEMQPDLDALIAGLPVEREDRAIPGPPGGPGLTVTILTPTGWDGPKGGVYHCHPGGMIVGTRFTGIEGLVHMAVEFGTVGVSVEYRLAPEHPHPAPSEDCYAGLAWMAGHAAELGFDPDRLIVQGASAGGGLSAALALMARDRGGPALAGQMLICPMIDDRNETPSSLQYDGIGIWDRNANHTGWTALLGEARGRPDVSPYAAPSRAADLSGLPPAYIEVGAAEVFRDEDAEYASRLWAAGVQAELHVWAGGFHGFSSFVPAAQVSIAANAARQSWLRRMFPRHAQTTSQEAEVA